MPRFASGKPQKKLFVSGPATKKKKICWKLERKKSEKKVCLLSSRGGGCRE